MSIIWRRPGRPARFTVWEGERGSSAYGHSYHSRAVAIVVAWWASLFAEHDVWIEYAPPTIRVRGDASEWDEWRPPGRPPFDPDASEAE